MDKLIPVIEFIKKNGFWIACGLVVVAFSVVWFLTTNRLTKETASAEQAIKSKISAAQAIRQVTPEGADDVNAHPNDSTVAGMKTEISESIDAVVQAWKDRYESQSQVRIWPAEVIANENFLKFFSQFNPPETFPTTNNGSQMLSLLSIYRQQIPSQMENIAAIARTKWKFQESPTAKAAAPPAGQEGRDRRPPSASGGGRTGQGGSGVAPLADSSNDRGVVLWNEENQELWQQKLTNFKGRDDHSLDTDDPSPLQVYTLQQDLWLLEAIFRIIAEVNGDVLATDLASIKQIDHIAFGREARAVLGAVQEPSSVIGAAADTSKKDDNKIPERERRNRSSSGRFGQQTGGVDFNDSADASPFHGRYVNANFEPIAAETVRKVLSGEDLPNDNLELIVAKRVPVRLGVVMDETKINEFVAACAKSPFTFEIHQIRINRHVPGEGIEFKGGQSAKKKTDRNDRSGSNLTVGGGGGAGSTANLDEGSGAGSGAVSDGSIGVGNPDNRRNFDVRVEFYGIVKIYNKVDEERLRKATGVEAPSAQP